MIQARAQPSSFPPGDTKATEGSAWAARAAVALALVLTIALVPLHLAFYRQAGPLWRDEVNSVNVATLSSFAEVLRHSHLDSFPATFVIALHSWTRIAGDADTQLRGFGLLVGMGILAALWWAAHRLHVSVPLASLLLFGLSPTAIIYGDSVRGYGLGALAMSLAVGAMWAFVSRPSGRTLVVALIALFLAVQTYYANSFLILALCAAGALICLRRRAYGVLLTVVVLGAVSGLSLLLGIESFTYALQVAPIEQGDWSLAWLTGIFRQALAPETPVLAWTWAIASLLAAAGCGLAWIRPSANDAGTDRDRALFVLVSSLFGIVTYFFYLKYVARLPTQFWYYLSLMALLALSCDVGISLLAQRLRSGIWVQMVLTALIFVLSVSSVLATVRIRMTNLDVIATQLQDDAQPKDLIVVTPWHTGITFQRYYRGAAPWMTLPDFPDHRFHTHLLVKEKMTRGDAGIAAEMARIETTLQSGGRVWLVGTPRAPNVGQPAPRLPPAPTGPQGWRAGPYRTGWELQMGAVLQDHAADIANVPLPDVGQVNAWEHAPLTRIQGWR